MNRQVEAIVYDNEDGQCPTSQFVPVQLEVRTWLGPSVVIPYVVRTTHRAGVGSVVPFLLPETLGLIDMEDRSWFGEV